MIAQRYRTILSKETPSINNCIEIAYINSEPFIITGGTEKKVYIYNINLEIIQEIEFDGWIRAITVCDLDNDNNNEFAVASGDNTLRVFKYSNHIFEELWKKTFDKKVSAVTAGDINADRRIEIIAGSWDNTIKVFDGLTGEFLWELLFTDWVTLTKTIDVNWDGVPEIVVGLKKGQFGVINGFTGECYWDYAFSKKVNDCDQISLDNSEFPYLVVGGDDKYLYIFNYEGILVNKLEMEDRILSVSHGDINGDHLNEIIMGLGNKKLVVYDSKQSNSKQSNSIQSNSIQPNSTQSKSAIIEEQMNSTQNKNEEERKEDTENQIISEENSEENISTLSNEFPHEFSRENVDLQFRWKASLPNVATGIKVHDIYADGIPDIIITGYLKQIKILQDTFFGQDAIKIEHENIHLKDASPINHEWIIKSLLGEEYEPELFLENGLFFFPEKITALDDLVDFDPDSIESYSSLNFMKIRNLRSNLPSIEEYDGPIEELILNLNENSDLKFSPSIKNFDQIESLASQIESLAVVVEEKPLKKKIKIEQKIERETITAETTEKEILPKVEEQILPKVEEQIPSSPNQSEIDPQNAIITYLTHSGNQPKNKILSDLVQLGFKDTDIEKAFNSLKTKNLISYSRKKPIGYYLTKVAEEKIPVSEVISEPVSEPISVLVPEITQEKTPKAQKVEDKGAEISHKEDSKKILFIQLLSDKKLVSTKAELEELMISNGITKSEFDSISKALISENILNYSRSKPRGYSITARKEIKAEEVKAEKVKTEKVKIEEVKTEETKTEETKTEETKTEEIAENLEENIDKFIKLVKSAGVISSKAKLIDLMKTEGFNEPIIELLMNKLKEEGILIYSRKTPRGYSIV